MRRPSASRTRPMPSPPSAGSAMRPARAVGSGSLAHVGRRAAAGMVQPAAISVVGLRPPGRTLSRGASAGLKPRRPSLVGHAARFHAAGQDDGASAASRMASNSSLERRRYRTMAAVKSAVLAIAILFPALAMGRTRLLNSASLKTPRTSKDASHSTRA
jgi:hypothetical protein